MSCAALLCCTALVLVLSAGAAHAQQGNLPKPVQKLPAYPPVACVTPDWRPEPCEDRHDIPQVMEEDRAQPALPLLNSRNTPRAFECIKPAEPGWLGLGGLFQLLDCTWFGWIEPYPVKPFDGKWHASQLAEPVKCLKPDGTEEPCESRQTAPPAAADEQAVKCLKPDGPEESCASRQSYFEPTKRYDAEGLEKLLPPPFGPTNKSFLGGERGGRINYMHRRIVGVGKCN